MSDKQYKRDLEAVKEDGRALQYVKKQTPEVSLEEMTIEDRQKLDVIKKYEYARTKFTLKQILEVYGGSKSNFLLIILRLKTRGGTMKTVKKLNDVLDSLIKNP